jgi:hypothetical protein
VESAGGCGVRRVIRSRADGLRPVPDGLGVLPVSAPASYFVVLASRARPSAVNVSPCAFFPELADVMPTSGVARCDPRRLSFGGIPVSGWSTRRLATHVGLQHDGHAFSGRCTSWPPRLTGRRAIPTDAGSRPEAPAGSASANRSGGSLNTSRGQRRHRPSCVGDCRSVPASQSVYGSRVTARASRSL